VWAAAVATRVWLDRDARPTGRPGARDAGRTA
ncbi:chromosome condensation protein CrcB, partial [Streptomyces sp. BF-3]